MTTPPDRIEAAPGGNGQPLLPPQDDGAEAVAAVVEEAAEPAPFIELPEDPAQAVELLLGELAAARAAAGEAEDKWKRTAAEFDNYRKRAHRSQAELTARASERLAVGLLPVLDSLDAAVGAGAEAPEETAVEAGMRQGLSGTRDLLLSVLAGEGLAPIEALGADFDPALHEAAQVGEGEGRMVVAAELRRGYTLKGRVVRAALVVVGYEEPASSGPDGAEPEPP